MDVNQREQEEAAQREAKMLAEQLMLLEHSLGLPKSENLVIPELRKQIVDLETKIQVDNGDWMDHVPTTLKRR